MRSFCTILTVSVFAILLCSMPMLAADHDALNGTWTLVPAQSNFGSNPAIQAGKITISKQGDTTTVSRAFRYGDNGEEIFYRDMTQTQGAAPLTASDLKSETSWSGDMMKVDTVHGNTNVTETYSLAPDGNLVVTVAHGDQPPETLVFTRK